MIIDRATVTDPDRGHINIKLHDDGRLDITSNQRGAWIITQLYLRGSLRIVAEKVAEDDGE